LGLAVVGITLDDRPDESVMQQVRDLEFVRTAHYLRLPELPPEEHED